MGSQRGVQVDYEGKGSQHCKATVVVVMITRRFDCHFFFSNPVSFLIIVSACSQPVSVRLSASVCLCLSLSVHLSVRLSLSEIR